jgi:hypothetical protein
MKDTSIPKGLLYSRLRRTVPHRIGIEFEGTGEFINHFLANNPSVPKSGEMISEDDVARYFGVREIKCDTEIGRLGNTWNEPLEKGYSSLEEVRVSINSFTQLHGLQKFLVELAKYLELCQGGGIHIHIDMSRYLSSQTPNRKSKVTGYLNNRLIDIESIFPKYKGHYNKRVVKEGKGSYVNVSGKNTLEFRIAPLTFDYEVLIQWIVKCNKLASEVINQCHLTSIKEIPIKPTTNEVEYHECIDEWVDVGPRDTATTIRWSRYTADLYLNGLNTNYYGMY